MIESTISKNGSIATSSNSSSNKEDSNHDSSATAGAVTRQEDPLKQSALNDIDSATDPTDLPSRHDRNTPAESESLSHPPLKEKDRMTSETPLTQNQNPIPNMKQGKEKKKKKKRKKRIKSKRTPQPKITNVTISPNASIDIQNDWNSLDTKDKDADIIQQRPYSSSSFLYLATNEYQATLKRRIEYTTLSPPSSPPTNNTISEKRTIFSKLSKPSSTTSTSSQTSSQGLDITQDMSLGMQLTILSGHVIVQSLNSLQDGRASPAQLSGTIERGDILTKINHINLRSLYGIELMEALQVLSSTTTHMKGPEERSPPSSSMEYTTSNQHTLSSSSPGNLSPNIITEKSHPNQWIHLTQSLTLTFVISAGLHLLEDTNTSSTSSHRLSRNTSLSKMTQKGMNAIYQKYQSIKEEAQAVSKEDVLDTLSLMLPKEFQLVDQFTGLPYNIMEEEDYHDQSYIDNNSSDIGKRKMDDDTVTVTSLLPHASNATGSVIDSSTAKNSLLQLSSLPLSPTNHDVRITTTSAPTSSLLSLQIPSQQTLTIISEQIANQISKKKWQSAFFQLDPKRSILYQNSTIDDIHRKIQEHIQEIQNKQQLLHHGQSIMKKMTHKLDLFQQTEDALLYSDHHHPPNHGNSSLMSINRSNHKRKDLQSLTLHEEKDDQNYPNDDTSDILNTSNYISDDDDITVESLLLTDAWKQRIMYQLQQATTYFSKQSNQPPHKMLNSSNHGTTNNINDDDGSVALESFLFGGLQQTKALTSDSNALPPMQVTSSLFDLVSSLERTAGGITVVTNSSRVGGGRGGGGSQSRRSLATESDHPNNSGASRVGEVDVGRRPLLISMMSKDRVKADKIYFLLQEALPLWLSTFQPLSVDKRRMLWPRHQNAGNFNTAINDSSFVDHGDDVSVISMGGVSAYTSSGGGGTHAGKAKQLREILEETKLNPASRMHTCRLVTVYFTQKVLIQQRNESTEIIKFIQKYGAYLNLYSCLVSASNYFLTDVIDQLLEVSSHDLHHNDAMGTLSKKGVLVLYEPVLLSALLESLKLSLLDDDALTLMISAYPDLKPWQVKQYCTSSGSEESSLYYYKYMTLLLDPTDGMQKARQDKELVSEWCDWSTSKSFSLDKRTVLHLVVTSKNKELYNRDVPMLIDFCMKINDHDLAMDLSEFDFDIHTIHVHNN